MHRPQHTGLSDQRLYQGMEQALHWAQQAGQAGEVPIGAVLVLDGVVRFGAANTCVGHNNPLAHAECNLLHLALPQLSQQEMRQASLFVTLEPCPMCMGAILHAHVGSLVFGAYNLKWGACGTVTDLSGLFPNQPLQVYGGILESECGALLASFFESLR